MSQVVGPFSSILLFKVFKTRNAFKVRIKGQYRNLNAIFRKKESQKGHLFKQLEFSKGTQNLGQKEPAIN